MLDPDPDSMNPDPEHWFTDLQFSLDNQLACTRKACTSAQIIIYRHLINLSICFSEEIGEVEVNDILYQYEVLFYHKLRQKISTCCVCADGFQCF
jgi:hypothetical protein